MSTWAEYIAQNVGTYAGLISAAIQTLMTPVYNVMGYGATGNGVYSSTYDYDTNAFKAAIIAAGAAPYGGTVYVPEGHYMMSTTISIPINVRIIMASGAVIDGTNCTGDAFQLQSGNFQSHLKFGSIQNYASGAGIHALPGASVADISFDSIGGCHDGLLVESSAAGSSLDSNWSGIWITNCTNASIHMKCTNNADILQGNVFNINFLLGNLHGILWDAPSGIAPNWNANAFNICAIDGSTTANSTGITTTNSNTVQGNIFNVTGFFGTLTTMINMPSSNSNTYNIMFNSSPALTATNFIVKGVANKITNLASATAPVWDNYYAMVTASGHQSSFNGGALMSANLNHMSLTLSSGLAAGASAHFYCYHAFTTGYTGLLHVTPRFTVPLVVIAVEDESVVTGLDNNQSPNQIHMWVYAMGAVSSGTYAVDLQVEG